MAPGGVGGVGSGSPVSGAEQDSVEGEILQGVSVSCFTRALRINDHSFYKAGWWLSVLAKTGPSSISLQRINNNS